MSGPIAKRWIGAQELLEDSLRLAHAVLASDWAPTLLVGLWRGGTPVAITVHEALAFHGVRCAHLPLATALYTGIDARAGQVRIEGLATLEPHLHDSARVLLVDDVFDTGRTAAAVVEAIAGVPGAAGELRLATVWWKPAHNQTALRPHYVVHETDRWLVFPHELEGHDEEELSEARGEGFMRALRGG